MVVLDRVVVPDHAAARAALRAQLARLERELSVAGAPARGGQRHGAPAAARA